MFVGIDLAWSQRNSTAASIISGDVGSGKLIASRKELRSNDDIVCYVLDNLGSENAVIAIDAPLAVPNETGIRDCDRLISRMFRKYDAGTYPANRSLLRKYGGLRGEEILQIFQGAGFEHNPFFHSSKEARSVVEVYPHPAMVVLFNLKKILKYKARANRSYDLRWKELKKYQEHIASLQNYDPSLDIPEELVGSIVTRLKGKALKSYEDLLDSVLCAYIGHYCWTHGRERCAVFGTLDGGCILTPVFNPPYDQKQRFCQ